MDLELNQVCGVYHVVSLTLDSPLDVEWNSGGGSIFRTIAPGQITIVPAGLPFSVRHRKGGKVVSVALETKFFLSATAEQNGLEPSTPLCTLGTDDVLLRELVLGIRAEAQRRLPESRLYAEALATTMAMHLARRYSGQPVKAPDYRGGLTKFQLRRVVEFIQEHLGENISLQALARIAGLSAFHFARMFKQSTNLAPHQYVIRSRVLKAKELLLVRNANIGDVAAQVGFCDPSHFAAHFKRVCGLTPSGFVQRMLPRKNSQ